MNRTSARKLVALAAACLLVVTIALPRLGAALPAESAACTRHVPTETTDLVDCPMCGGSWDDFIELMGFTVDLQVGLLVALVN